MIFFLLIDLTYLRKTSSGEARMKCAINKVKIPKVKEGPNLSFLTLRLKQFGFICNLD